jgi:hypothetical protein
MNHIDWNVILTGLLYAALTGAFNLLFAHKSQINAWCEANPKLAAALKVSRAIGLDPQHLWAALALAVKKKLPKVQTEEPKDKDGGPGDGSAPVGKITPLRPLPRDLTDPPPPFAAMNRVVDRLRARLALALVAFSVACGPTSRLKPVKAPCDEESLANLVAECTAKAFACGHDGVPKDECVPMANCNNRLDLRREQCL